MRWTGPLQMRRLHSKWEWLHQQSEYVRNSMRHYADSLFSYVPELLTVTISSFGHFYGGSEIAAFTFRQNVEIWNRAQSCCHLQQSARTASVVKTGGYAAVIAVEYESKREWEDSSGVSHIPVAVQSHTLLGRCAMFLAICQNTSLGKSARLTGIATFRARYMHLRNIALIIYSDSHGCW